MTKFGSINARCARLNNIPGDRIRIQDIQIKIIIGQSRDRITIFIFDGYGQFRHIDAIAKVRRCRCD